MFARVVTTQVAPGKLDDATRIAQQQLIAPGQLQPEGFYLLIDRGSGKLMTIPMADIRGRPGR